jgi:hypothetical protein
VSLPARLFGPDREEITDLDSWLAHAPPEKGLAQWKDGYSAKEQAKAWLRSGTPRMPDELWRRLSDVASGIDEVFGRPEHKTRLDNHSRARQHDMLACLRRNGQTTLVIGVKPKACEDFDGTVSDRATAAPPSKKRARRNLLARALFGRDVIDEQSGKCSIPASARTATSCGRQRSARSSRPNAAISITRSWSCNSSRDGHERRCTSSPFNVAKKLSARALS